MLTLYHLLIYMRYLYLDPDHFSNSISSCFLKKCITDIFSDVSQVTCMTLILSVLFISRLE